ncbi:hypothetical protein [Alicyclobacillus sp. SO9]|uniref:hypothetical protein n=1 Tax=Alicyclobacillus sp. SO9 TaxID=2665646 RepID=UPI0018E8DA56|nr:hypothetical protein [Alicyclobacillus sp. SO9]QQE80436.1 hypothetical protein GI364_08485 [Alicyclobacillus sp. SO9]
MSFAHHRLLEFMNNPWVTSIITGLISGLLVAEWYKFKDEKNAFVDRLYDLHLYVELVRRGLERYKENRNIDALWDIVVMQEQGKLYKDLLGYTKQNEETKKVIRAVMGTLYEELYYDVRLQQPLDQTYVYSKLSELAKLNIQIIAIRDKHINGSS